MAQGLTSKMVQQQGARIGRVEDQIRHAEQLLAASHAQDASHAARRFYATLVGVPLGVTAFLFIGVFWNAANGTGIYVGIVCALILWLIAKHILGLPASETATIGLQVQRLEKERARLQESLKKYIGDDGTSAASADKSTAAG